MRLRAHANGALILKFFLVLGSAAAQDAAQDGDKDSGGEEVEKRLLVFPDTNLPDSGSFCQSPLGTSGRCVPYQECRFLFNDEFLARRSLCGFNGRVSLVCCPQQGQGFGNGFGGGLGGGGGGGGIVFPEVPQVPQNFPNIAGGGGGFGPPRRPFGQGGGLPPNRNPFGGGGGQFGGRFPGNHRTPRPSGPYNSPRPQGPRQWGTSNCGVASSALVRIVGGRESNLGAWPWITLLFIDVHGNGVRSPLCGGALITPQHVLTAAHCTFNGNKSLTPDAFVARLGEHDYLSNDDGANPVDEPVVQIHRHSDFNSRTYLNDVAVLKLRRPVPLNKDIALICLPYGPLQTDTYEGKMANIAGWGELYYGERADRAARYGFSDTSAPSGLTILLVLLRYLERVLDKSVYRPIPTMHRTWSQCGNKRRHRSLYVMLSCVDMLVVEICEEKVERMQGALQSLPLNSCLLGFLSAQQSDLYKNRRLAHPPVLLCHRYVHDLLRRNSRDHY